ncbi:hypothetical protein QR680_009779 [Steinernema hermaphroditum]|uniref:Secreted protein n=1 Tax=Steinernema hermaphroditum TaxID=289476 RepID=A0AA39ILM7_9BILA|nr:hypothetical protein QR680_009779 [Steinernema hermaphroditum]
MIVLIFLSLLLPQSSALLCFANDHNDSARHFPPPEGPRRPPTEVEKPEDEVEDPLTDASSSVVNITEVAMKGVDIFVQSVFRLFHDVARGVEDAVKKICTASSTREERKKVGRQRA